MTNPYPATAGPASRGSGPGTSQIVLVVLVCVTAVLGAAGVGFVASTAGDLPGASLSIVYALIPVPAILGAYWWLDRVEPEPVRYKAAAFVWGAVVAVLIALALESLAAHLGVREDVLATVVAPFVEEFAKGLFLVLTLVRSRRIIDGVLDGIIVSGIVALGFAMTENVGYYAASYIGFDDLPSASGFNGTTATFVVRGLFSPFAHPLFTSVLGICMGLAARLRTPGARVVVIVVGYLGSVSLHAIWNGSLSFGGGIGFVLAYLLLGGLFVVLAAVAIVLRIKQIDTLRKSLTYIAARGWIHPAEVPWLVSFSRRREAQRFAAFHAGEPARAALKRYQALAVELGFLHDAIMMGRRRPGGVEHSYALLDQMNALRPMLLFPPALPPGIR